MDNSTAALLWTAACYCLIISFSGSIANLVALICVIKSPNLNNGMKVILFNAFLPSLMISSFIMPFFFKFFSPSSFDEEEDEDEDEIDEEEEKWHFVCKGKIPVPDIIFGFLSALTLIELNGLALLSFYRLLAISSPNHYNHWISIFRTVILCSFCWVFSFSLWGIIWGLKLIKFNSDHCFFEADSILIQRIISCLIYGIPLLLTVIFLLATHIKIQKQILRIRSNRSSTHSLQEHKINHDLTSTIFTEESLELSSTLNCGSNNSIKLQRTESGKILPSRRDSLYKKSLKLVTRYYTLRSSPIKKEANRFLKATKNIWIILVLFCVINVPHVVVHIVGVHKSVAVIFIVLHLIHWIHLVVDPLIYILLNKRDFVHLYQLIKVKVKCNSV